MTKIEIESLSDVTNAAVVRIPGRKFPGIVIQGDSLHNLLAAAAQVAELSRDTGVAELEDLALEVVNLLSGYCQTYEQAMRDHNQPLPY